MRKRKHTEPTEATNAINPTSFDPVESMESSVDISDTKDGKSFKQVYNALSLFDEEPPRKKGKLDKTPVEDKDTEKTIKIICPPKKPPIKPENVIKVIISTLPLKKDEDYDERMDDIERKFINGIKTAKNLYIDNEKEYPEFAKSVICIFNYGAYTFASYIPSQNKFSIKESTGLRLASVIPVDVIREKISKVPVGVVCENTEKKISENPEKEIPENKISIVKQIRVIHREKNHAQRKYKRKDIAPLASWGKNDITINRPEQLRFGSKLSSLVIPHIQKDKEVNLQINDDVIGKFNKVKNTNTLKITNTLTIYTEITKKHDQELAGEKEKNPSGKKKKINSGKIESTKKHDQELVGEEKNTSGTKKKNYSGKKVFTGFGKYSKSIFTLHSYEGKGVSSIFEKRNGHQVRYILRLTQTDIGLYDKALDKLIIKDLENFHVIPRKLRMNVNVIEFFDKAVNPESENSNPYAVYTDHDKTLTIKIAISESMKQRLVKIFPESIYRIVDLTLNGKEEEEGYHPESSGIESSGVEFNGSESNTVESMEKDMEVEELGLIAQLKAEIGVLWEERKRISQELLNLNQEAPSRFGLLSFFMGSNLTKQAMLQQELITNEISLKEKNENLKKLVSPESPKNLKS